MIRKDKQQIREECRRMQIREANQRYRARKRKKSFIEDKANMNLKRRRNQIRESTRRWRKNKTCTGPSSEQSVEMGCSVCGVKKGVVCDTELHWLIQSAWDMKWFDNSVMERIERNEAYSKHVILNLVRFYACQSDAGAWVYNNESICGDDGKYVRDRIKKCLDGPIGIEEYERVQNSVDSVESIGQVFACASCNEVALKSEGVLITSIEEIPMTYAVSDEDRLRICKMPMEIVNAHVSVFQHNNGTWYYLNPDLVVDDSFIVRCRRCGTDPKKYKFSIARGHDYGRLGMLPKLNMVALNCIRPFRIFGVHVNLDGQSGKGHKISFASDGPTQSSSVLPWIPQNDELPTVTFFGNGKLWENEKTKYRTQYEMPIDDIFAWLSVLCHTHRLFKDKGIQIDKSQDCRQKLAICSEMIENSAIVVGDEKLYNVYKAAKYDDVSEEIEQDIACKIGTESVIFQPTSTNVEGPMNAAIETMLNIVVPQYGDNNQDKCATNVDIHRAENPACEFTMNNDILSGAFCDLFLFGNGLPQGIASKDFHHHCSRFYDGRFDNSQWIGINFNQLQRSSSIRKAARVGTTNSSALKKLSKLANSVEFRNQLEDAREHPERPKSKRINAHLMRVISLVGENVPFSIFERLTTRCRSMSMRYKFGPPVHFVTFSPPEQDDLLLLSIAECKHWNKPENICEAQNTFHWNNLGKNLRESATERLKVARSRPFLAAAMFQRKLDMFCNDIVRCPMANAIRSSRTYLNRESGAFSKIAGINGVVEPQNNKEGRLHVHICLYSHAYTPELLTRLASCSQMEDIVQQWIDSILTTGVSETVKKWYEALEGNDICRQRSGELMMPRASENCEEFVLACEKRLILTGIHQHKPLCCMKGKKGRYMCRLCRPAGIHDTMTCPLQVILHKTGNSINNTKPVVEGRSLDELTRQYLDLPYNVNVGEFLQRPLATPIVWEAHRDKKDGMFIENNMLMALMKCASHSTLISGEASAEAVNEYITTYMVKEEPGMLTEGATAILGAINHIKHYPSTSDDSGTDLRTGKHIATRVVNKFIGSYEWKPQLMASALLGVRSQITSERFWFIFPHEFVQFFRKQQMGHNYCKEEEDKADDCSVLLDELSNVLNLDSNAEDHGAGGTRRFELLDSSVIFLTQAESYYNRGPSFKNLSPLEFESIIDILPKRLISDNNGRGRRQRKGITLGKHHPLYETHQAYLRAKYKTVMLGGKPPPSYPGSKIELETVKNSARAMKNWETQMQTMVEYIICLVVPWHLPSIDVDTNEEASVDLNVYGPIYPTTIDGFRSLCNAWDNSNASVICKQRYRYIRNIMKAHYRCHRNEMACSAWRERNADWWKDCAIDTSTQKRAKVHRANDKDENHEIYASDDNVLRLTQLATSGEKDDRCTISQIQKSCNTMFQLQNKTLKSSNIKLNDAIVYDRDKPSVNEQIKCHSLARIASMLSKMEPTYSNEEDIFNEQEMIDFHPFNPLSGATTFISSGATSKQLDIIKHVVNSIDTEKQALTMLQGPGGSGKTFCVKIITAEIEKRKMRTINCCPTGVGACLMPHGETFHRIFNTSVGKELSGPQLDKMRRRFTKNVALIVVDEVSMLSAEQLVMLDSRLQTLYNANQPFGGKSILLVGDFFQLPVCTGTNLYDAMYRATSHDQIAARSRIELFRIFYLEEHIRAQTCHEHVKHLQQFRSLPNARPYHEKWTKDDRKNYKPMTPDLLNVITMPLTQKDIATDPNWLKKVLVITTGNLERAAFNCILAKEFGKRHNRVVIRWRRSLFEALPEALEDLLYREDERPQLFAYFVYDAPVQILSNANGNVAYGVANGTSATMHSVVWNDTSMNAAVKEIVRNTIPGNVVDIPFPPDFINVRLIGRDGSTWPDELNLETEYKESTQGRIKNSVVIPIGLLIAKQSKKSYQVKIGSSTKFQERIPYRVHAVDLAFAKTVWKSQGSTYDYVLAYLESTKDSPSWGFEHLYVAFSRVRMACRFRCFPLSVGFDKNRLSQLRPRICAIKFKMDCQKSNTSNFTYDSIQETNSSMTNNDINKMSSQHVLPHICQHQNNSCTTCIISLYRSYCEKTTYNDAELILKQIMTIPTEKYITPKMIKVTDVRVTSLRATSREVVPFIFTSSVVHNLLQSFRELEQHDRQSYDGKIAILSGSKVLHISTIRIMQQIHFAVKQYQQSQYTKQWLQNLARRFSTQTTKMLLSSRKELTIIAAIRTCESHLFSTALTRTLHNSPEIYCSTIHDHLACNTWFSDDIIFKASKILVSAYNQSVDVVCSPYITNERTINNQFLNKWATHWLQQRNQASTEHWAFLPIHFPSHWCGIAIYFPSETIKVYDPLCHNQNLLALHEMAIINIVSLMPRLQVVTIQEPTQKDGFNCGLYIYIWFESLLSNITFSQKTLTRDILSLTRLRIMHDIVT